MSGMNEIIEQLSKTLPPIIVRAKIHEICGGLFGRGFLQNCDSRGCGPRRIRGFKKVAYTREDFLTWLEERIVIEEPRKKTASHLPPWKRGNEAA